MLNRTRKSLLALSLIAAACGAAHAEGLYAGGSLGTPFYNSTVNGAGVTGGGHDTGVGLQAYGGWQFHPNFALEAGLFTLGHSRAASTGGDVNARGGFVDAVGSYSFAPKWSVLGRVGLAEAQLRTDAGNDTSPALKAGLGVQYDLTSKVALRVGYDRYRFTNAFDDKPQVGQTTFGVKVGF